MYSTCDTDVSVLPQCWLDKSLSLSLSTPVKQPPTIVKQSLKNYIVAPGDSIIIECEAKGNPVPTWEWAKPFFCLLLRHLFSLSLLLLFVCFHLSPLFHLLFVSVVLCLNLEDIVAICVDLDLGRTKNCQIWSDNMILEELDKHWVYFEISGLSKQIANILSKNVLSIQSKKLPKYYKDLIWELSFLWEKASETFTSTSIVSPLLSPHHALCLTLPLHLPLCPSFFFLCGSLMKPDDH